jgi:hypothetical protein
MKPLVPLGALLAARLALACGAWAQEPPGGDTAAQIPRRLEAGGSLGSIWGVPTAGLLASVPATDWLALEATTGHGSGYAVRQAQVRVPFGLHRRSRRSLVVGLTHLSGETEQFVKGLHGHVGASFQVAADTHLDLRTDVQLLLPFQREPAADPRVIFAFVWHR